MRRVINASDHFSWHLHRWMICPVSCSLVIWASLSAQRAFSLFGICSRQALISKHPLPWMIQIITPEIINCFTKNILFDGSKTSTFLNCWHSNQPESFIVWQQWPTCKRLAIVLPPVDLSTWPTIKWGPSVHQPNTLGNQRACTRWSCSKLCARAPNKFSCNLLLML